MIGKPGKTRLDGGKDPRARRGLYLWLGRKMGFEEREIAEKCHIAMFDANQCQRVIEICKAADPERKP